jgi:hypothetical protein
MRKLLPRASRARCDDQAPARPPRGRDDGAELSERKRFGEWSGRGRRARGVRIRGAIGPRIGRIEGGGGDRNGEGPRPRDRRGQKRRRVVGQALAHQDRCGHDEDIAILEPGRAADGAGTAVAGRGSRRGGGAAGGRAMARRKGGLPRRGGRGGPAQGRSRTLGRADDAAGHGHAGQRADQDERGEAERGEPAQHAVGTHAGMIGGSAPEVNVRFAQSQGAAAGPGRDST